jgi:hypothetical protein
VSEHPAAQPISTQASTFFSGFTTQQKLIGGAIVAIVLTVLFFGGVSGGRVVTINGYQLNDQEVAYLDALAGGQVPGGDYWFDPQTTAWGLVGNAQPMGVVGYAGAQGQGSAPQWGDVGQNYRGPFGDYMSDGQCSFVNGVPVGNC